VRPITFADELVAKGDLQARTVGVNEGYGAALVIRTSDVVEDDPAIRRPSRLAARSFPEP
jgi:hypothetical protein